MMGLYKLWNRVLHWRPERDPNYYGGLFLLQMGTLTIAWYLLFDRFEPIAFLITFLIVAWGFVLLWKSDNDLRFQLAQQRIIELEEELSYLKRLI
jgi:hypothetical protein